MTTSVPLASTPLAGAAPRAWRDPTILVAIVINLAIYLYALAVSRSGGGSSLDLLLVEDGLVEWLQFLAFATLAVVLALIALDRATRSGAGKLEVLVLFGLSGVVALAAMEEISWFQRVLNVESSEFFRANNRQGETNLHNMAVGGSSLNKLVLIKLIFLVGITHNLVLPLLARRSARLQRFVESWGLYLPPLAASVPYLVLVLLSHTTITHNRVGELGEVFGAMHYLATVFAAYGLGIAHGRAPVFGGAADRLRASALFASFLLLLVFFAWLLQAAYTVVR